MQAESVAEDPVSSSGSGEAAEQQGGQGWLSGFKLPWQAEAAQNGSQNQVSRDHSRDLFWVRVRVRVAGGEPLSLRFSRFIATQGHHSGHCDDMCHLVTKGRGDVFWRRDD